MAGQITPAMSLSNNPPSILSLPKCWVERLHTLGTVAAIVASPLGSERNPDGVAKLTSPWVCSSPNVALQDSSGTGEGNALVQHVA